MDSINSFIHLLDKIETQDRRLGMTIKNLRCLTGGKSMELAPISCQISSIKMALRLVRSDFI